MATGRVALGLVLLLVLVGSTHSVPNIRQKCSACQCITRELRYRLEDEKPRNHLDLRHRLDQTGKRYGKVIDYRISELRAVELLDGICEEMKNYVHASYVISKSGKTTEQWQKWNGRDATAFINSTRHENSMEQALQKQLQLYCGAVMEEWEEELEGAIMAGKFEDPDAIEDFLCKDRVKACPDGTVPRVWIEEPEEEPAPAPEASPEDAAAQPAGEGTGDAAAPTDAAAPAPEAAEVSALADQAEKQEL